ncbi:MAG: DUF6290 family protein [bacterium]
MLTKNPRLNITFDPKEEKFLTALAKQERKSVSRLATELILEALERREDMAFSAIAGERDNNTKETVVHKDAWK